jgi:uncharacterized membrane protein
VKLDFEIFCYQVVFTLSHMLVSEFGVNASLSTSLRKVKLDFEIFCYQVVFTLSHMLVSEFGVNASLSTSLRKVKLDFEIFCYQVVFGPVFHGDLLGESEPFGGAHVMCPCLVGKWGRSSFNLAVCCG